MVAAVIDEAARGIGVSTRTLSRWLRGDYEGDSDTVARKARAWLETQAEARALTLAPAGLDVHAALGVTDEAMAAMAYAQATGDVVLIHGRSGAGKSPALGRYAAGRASMRWPPPPA